MHVAIVGSGQLARMLAQAGEKLGMTFSFAATTEEETTCVENLGHIEVYRPGTDSAALFRRLGSPSFLTVEKEQVDLEILRILEPHCAIRPSINALYQCQHRLREKKLLESLDIPVAPFRHGISVFDSLEALGSPVVVKACADGYDGKNQWHVQAAEQALAFDRQKPATDYLVEKKVAFDKELSLLSVRTLQGDTRHYPLSENVHKNGILRRSMAPATVPNRIAMLAHSYMQRIMDALDYVGVLAMECFVVGDALLVNELAPRVHNSGHWTQSGSDTCQFENHLRAISGMDLGSTRSVGFSGMLNIIGTPLPAQQCLPITSCINWYGKTLRKGRKLGHINVSGSSRAEVRRQLDLAEHALSTANAARSPSEKYVSVTG